MLVKGMKMQREGDGGKKSGFFFGDFLGPPCALARTTSPSRSGSLSVTKGALTCSLTWVWDRILFAWDEECRGENFAGVCLRRNLITPLCLHVMRENHHAMPPGPSALIPETEKQILCQSSLDTV